MANPDPVKFAQGMLWHVCGLRAEVLTLQMQIAEMHHKQTGEDLKTETEKWKKISAKTHQDMYLQALKEAKLPLPDGEPESQNGQ